MTDTRPHLASLNIEQIDAILEIIRAAPDHANSDTVAVVVEETIREARDRAFEIEKLAKAAIEDVLEATGNAPSPALVELIVGSVWENVHKARHPHGEYDEGLLPGWESGLSAEADAEMQAAAEARLDRNPEVKERIIAALSDTSGDVRVREVGTPTGTAQVATVTEGGGSRVPPLRLKGEAASAFGAAVIEEVTNGDIATKDDGEVLRSAPYVTTFGEDGAVPTPQPEATPYHLDLVEDDTLSDDKTTINDVTDRPMLDGLIAEAADAPPVAVSPAFGSMTSDPKPGSPFWTEPNN